MHRFLATAAIATFACWTFAYAAGGDIAEHVAPQATDSAGYSDTDLGAFAAAASDIQDLADAYASRIVATSDPAQRDQLAMAAVREMTAAIEKQGLSVERFEQILDSSRADTALVDRINQRVNAAQERGSARDQAADVR